MYKRYVVFSNLSDVLTRLRHQRSIKHFFMFAISGYLSQLLLPEGEHGDGVELLEDGHGQGAEEAGVQGFLE